MMTPMDLSGPLTAARRLKHRAMLARRRWLTEKGRADARRRSAGARVAETAWVWPSARVDPGAVVGAYSWVNEYAQIDAGAVVGRNVGIAPGAYLCTGTHVVGGREQRTGEYVTDPCVVEDGCWIGANATILPGVTVAKGCIVAAGAVVTRNTAPDGLYAGIPARRVRELP